MQHSHNLSRWVRQLVLATGLLLADLLGSSHPAAAQQARPEDTLVVNPARPQLYVEENDYSVLEDPTGRSLMLSISSISISSSISSPSSWPQVITSRFSQPFRSLHKTSLMTGES